MFNKEFKMAQGKKNPKENKEQDPTKPSLEKDTIKWDHEEDNCGINPDENPCGDANEY